VADITVQVSSAGLTAYGTSEWGSQTYGGDNTSTTIVGSADAFNNQGWGRLSWNSLVWGQDFENQTVQVTTPVHGEWGLSTWGDNTFGGIAGMDFNLGNGALTVSVDVQIDTTSPDIGMNTGTGNAVAGASAEVIPTGSESTSTVGDAFGGEVNEVQVTSPSNDPWGNEAWGNGLWGVGDGITLLGDASVLAQGDGFVTLTGSEANTSVGQIEIPVVIDSGIEITSTTGNAFGGEVVEVQVTSASATPWGETAWGDGFWGNGVGTDIAIGADAVLTPSIEVLVTGEQLDWTIGTENVTGDANITLSGVSADIFQGDENAFTDVTIEPTGQQLTTQLADVVAGISQLVTPTGVTATTTTGTMGINAWAVIQPNATTTWSVVDKAAA